MHVSDAALREACSPAARAARRDQWFAMVRERLGEVFTPDGHGRMPQFESPFREPVWILPALYRGPRETVDLANRIVELYHQTPDREYKGFGNRSGMLFNIFQSNSFAELLHSYGDRLTPRAREVMSWHAEQVFKTFAGSAQPDYNFHGANDNMPAMSTVGLILGGEALGNEAAVRHGVWKLHQVRRLLSRSAWMSEYNSSTYSAITLASFAKIASAAHSPEVRELARQLEARLWAEILLHYHPGTFRQAGPQTRAYPIDYAGHNHTLQMLLWVAFGTELCGRDLPASYFRPDGTEVIHFDGCYWQSIAEYCHAIDTDLHLPDELAPLIVRRDYPAVLRGRAEAMMQYEMCGEYRTETYMEEDWSLGTTDRPMGGAEQTAQMYLTARLRPHPASFRDAGSAFPRYFAHGVHLGEMGPSLDGGFRGEQFFKNDAWSYTIHKANTAALLTSGNLRQAPIESAGLSLLYIFATHYGQIEESVMGDGEPRPGIGGESAVPVPVSVAWGQVYVYLQPLVPTSLPRGAAMRWREAGGYQALEIVNYEGPSRLWGRLELGRVLNGLVLTVESRANYRSLLDFHREKTACRIVDYYFAGHRFFEYHRADVSFDVTLTTDPFGVQAAAVDGRHRPCPVMESNQLDVRSLPLMTGPVAPNFPHFPWASMELECYEISWMIGARGVPGEQPYSACTGSLRNAPDGLRRTALPEQAAAEDARREREARLLAQLEAQRQQQSQQAQQ